MRKLVGSIAGMLVGAVVVAAAVAVVPSGATTRVAPIAHLSSRSYAYSDSRGKALSAAASQKVGHSQTAGSGFLGIFNEATTATLEISMNGAPPVQVGQGDFNYGLVAAGTYSVTATEGATLFARGMVVVGAGQNVTALIYLAPNGGHGAPVITGFVNARSAPPVGSSRVVFRNTSTEKSVDMYLNGKEVASGLGNNPSSPTSVSAIVPAGEVSIYVTRHGQPITKPLYFEVGKLLPGNLLNVFVVGAFSGSYQFLTNSIPLGAGYRLYAADGGVFSFGNAGFYGSTGSIHLNQPVVGASTASVGLGYWMAAADGGIFAFGSAGFYGSAGDIHLNNRVVGMASLPDDSGYWMVASDGGIFSYGVASFYGSMGSQPLNQPIVGMAATPGGGGYWLVAADGGVFSFGDAHFYGSTGDLKLNKPIVGIIPTADGAGYWLVASDGGVFSFGDAHFYGSTGGLVLNKPVVAGVATPDSLGYWLVASDGGVFSFGDAQFYGSTGSLVLNEPIVAATGQGQPLPG